MENPDTPWVFEMSTGQYFKIQPCQSTWSHTIQVEGKPFKCAFTMKRSGSSDEYYLVGMKKMGKINYIKSYSHLFWEFIGSQLITQQHKNIDKRKITKGHVIGMYSRERSI